MRDSAAYLLAAVIALPISGFLVGQSLAEAPLSASDWLSGSVKGPARESSAWRPGDPVPPAIEGQGNPKPVAESGVVGEITVTRLDGSNPDLAGTITAGKARLPRDLWTDSETATITQNILQTPARLPAMNKLLQRILVAQLRPPQDADMHRGKLFLARTDRLLDMGALEPARNLLMAAGGREPDQFRRLFDIALLEGEEALACERMISTPGIAPSLSARIFCLAHSGDWAAASIGLNGGEDLGLLDETQIQLLTHFLHDAYVDSGEQLPPPEPVTPLEFRIHEAIGQPLPTQHLPLAFAQSDLRANSGWKARLEAAERLARAGAIAPEKLRQIYAEQKPAASGGVWERATAMRKLEAAIAAGDPSAALERSFEVFRLAGMADVLAAMIADDLPMDSEGKTGDIAGWLRQWEGLETRHPVDILPELQAGESEFSDEAKGDILFEAMADIDAGLDGDLARAANGLATLRDLGLDMDADLAATQLSLLPQMRDAPG